jgi:hypothetical protein
MEVVSPYGITWAVYYRTLAVMSMVTVVASKVGVPVVSEIPTLLWASGFLAVFAISTVSQLWSRRWFYLRSLLPDRR